MSRPHSVRRLVSGAVTLAATAAVATACGSSSHAAPHSSQPPLGYRALPSFLPSASTPVDRVVTAEPGHPQLAVQGVAVAVHLPAGHVLATVTGPHVPPFVSPPPEQVTATFDVSLSGVSGRVPVRLQDFVITDQLGRTFRPTYVTGETAPDAVAPAGRTTRFRVTAVMPTGEGRIYWTAGRRTPVVGWDFIVEND